MAKAPLRSWLLGIARHKVEAHYRRQLREPEPLAESGHPSEPSAADMLIDELIDRERLEARTQRVLRQLPESYGLALLWRYCWVAVTPNGRFAYVTNTGSGSIAGYAVDFDGTLDLLDPTGRSAVTGNGSAPIDLALADNGRFLYSLNSGTNTIGVFRVRSDGALTRLPFTGGLPSGTNGLAAR